MPTPIPSVPANDRKTSFAPVSPTTDFQIDFDVWNDASDLDVYVAGDLVTTGWTLVQSDGSPILTSTARPLVAPKVRFSTARSSVAIVIYGRRVAARAAQATEGAPVTARDFNRSISELVAVTQELRRDADTIIGTDFEDAATTATTKAAEAAASAVSAAASAASASSRVAKSGDTMTGKLITVASASGGAGLNLPQGAAPSTPGNGDIWTQTTGVFARIAGATFNLLPPQAVRAFTVSGSWTKPAFGTWARITAIGGGGGGGASNAATTASNGGESAVPVVAVFLLSALPATLTIDVGGGGLGAAAAPAAGGNGGNTRAWSGAGNVIVAPGGVGGSGTSATTWNGVTSLPTVASYGYPLLGAAYTGFTPPAWGTSGTPFADRARGAPKSATSGAAAQIGLTSVFGKGGNSSAANSGAGAAATGYGAGGGGGFATGGAGAPGYLLIEVF